MWEFVDPGRENVSVREGSFLQVWTFQGPEGYEDRLVYVSGPFFHGSRNSSLSAGDLLTPGHSTNSWGDEGEFSRFVHFTDCLETARLYAREAGGSVYEVEPTGDFVLGYVDGEFKSEGTLRIIRKKNDE